MNRVDFLECLLEHHDVWIVTLHPRLQRLVEHGVEVAKSDAHRRIQGPVKVTSGPDVHLKPRWKLR